MTDVLSEKQKQMVEQEERPAKDLSTGSYAGDLVIQTTKGDVGNPFLPERKAAATHKS